MQISESGLNLIKTFEGCRLQSYQDSGGVWTIGYGHTNGVGPGQVITQQQADEFLKQDLHNAEKYVMAYDHIYHFNQNQFDALVSFTYNAGAGNLKKLLSSGTKPIEIVHKDLLNCCVRAKGKLLKGLVRRRNAEFNMMGDCTRDLSVVAKEVTEGKWGNGKARQQLLTDAGYIYSEVQEEVNRQIREASINKK